MWFQQNDATCHIARITTDLLKGEFGERTPRSCDLTPLDYFLWGYVKAHAYIDKPTSIDSLKDNIKAFIREISAEMLLRVCQN